jgi:hypothetical protein
MSIRSHFPYAYTRSGSDENRGLMPEAKEVTVMVDGKCLALVTYMS